MAKTRSSPKTDLVLQYLATHSTATMNQIVTDLKAQGISESLVKLVKYAGKQKKPATAKKKHGRKATGAKASAAPTNASSAGGTKAEAIRAVAKSLPKPFRPLDVRAELAKQGIDATTTFIGKVLRAAGMKRKRRKAANGSGIPSPSDVRAAILARRNAPVTIDDLVAAKKLVGQVGSIEKVREALAALARLG